MDKKSVEKALAGAVRALSDILPLKSYLLFPVVYSVCVWAVRRVFDYRARILSWQAWLEPGAIGTKPDDFVLQFFRHHGGLAREYAEELEARNMKVLRKAFARLYPVVGIEDPFFQGLFGAELKAGDYRQIVAEFAARGAKARADIAAATARRPFLAGSRSRRNGDGVPRDSSARGRRRAPRDYRGAPEGP